LATQMSLSQPIDPGPPSHTPSRLNHDLTSAEVKFASGNVMAETKVQDHELRAYLDAGHSQADAARHFGVSEPAIHQRLKRMRALTSQVVALERAGQVVDEKLTATARLAHVQQVIDDELAWAVQQARQDGADRTGLAD